MHSALVVGLLRAKMIGRSFRVPMALMTSCVNSRPAPDTPGGGGRGGGGGGGGIQEVFCLHRKLLLLQELHEFSFMPALEAEFKVNVSQLLMAKKEKSFK